MPQPPCMQEILIDRGQFVLEQHVKQESLAFYGASSCSSSQDALPAKMGFILFWTLECPIYRVHPAVTIAGQPVSQTFRAPVLFNGETVHAARAQMRIGDRPALPPNSGFALLRAQI